MECGIRQRSVSALILHLSQSESERSFTVPVSTRTEKCGTGDDAVCRADVPTRGDWGRDGMGMLRGRFTSAGALALSNDPRWVRDGLQLRVRRARWRLHAGVRR